MIPFNNYLSSNYSTKTSHVSKNTRSWQSREQIHKECADDGAASGRQCSSDEHGGIAFLHVQICDTKIDDDSGAIGKCINDRARKAGDAVNKCQR